MSNQSCQTDFVEYTEFTPIVTAKVVKQILLNIQNSLQSLQLFRLKMLKWSRKTMMKSVIVMLLTVVVCVSGTWVWEVLH